MTDFEATSQGIIKEKLTVVLADSIFKHDLRHIPPTELDAKVPIWERTPAWKPERINEIINHRWAAEMVTVEEVNKELEKVVDPEIGLPITEMHLVDEITIKEDGEIYISYHLTAPFCPPIFAEDIGMNIRQLTSKLEGVKKVTVVLHGHALAAEINTRVNPGYIPQA